MLGSFIMVIAKRGRGIFMIRDGKRAKGSLKKKYTNKRDTTTLDHCTLSMIRHIVLTKDHIHHVYIQSYTTI